jgi:hypothetical protein
VDDGVAEARNLEQYVVAIRTSSRGGQWPSGKDVAGRKLPGNLRVELRSAL